VRRQQVRCRRSPRTLGVVVRDAVWRSRAADSPLEDTVIRDAMAAVLRERGGTRSGKDPATFDQQKPRLACPGKRPIWCGAPATEAR
jgi:hypothetical protein